MANPVPALDSSARHFALHPRAHERVANLSRTPEGWDDVGQAAQRSFYKMEQLETRPHFAVRRDRRAGGACIYVLPLCVVLSADGPQGECAVGKQNCRVGGATRDAVP